MLKSFTTPSLAVLSLLVSGLSAYYAWSAQIQSQNLFLVEHRPYINIEIPKLEGKYLQISNGAGKMTAQFSIELDNEGGIPAKDINIKIDFLDNNQNIYQQISIVPPGSEKILSNGVNFLNPSIQGEVNDSNYKAIQSGKLQFQIEVDYKSDVDENISYSTIMQFVVASSSINLIGNLGEFQ